MCLAALEGRTKSRREALEFLLASAVVVGHALGSDSWWRQPSQAVLARVERSQFCAKASIEMLEEVIHHWLRRS